MIKLQKDEIGTRRKLSLTSFGKHTYRVSRGVDSHPLFRRQPVHYHTECPYYTAEVTQTVGEKEEEGEREKDHSVVRSGGIAVGTRWRPGRVEGEQCIGRGGERCAAGSNNSNRASVIIVGAVRVHNVAPVKAGGRPKCRLCARGVSVMRAAASCPTATPGILAATATMTTTLARLTLSTISSVILSPCVSIPVCFFPIPFFSIFPSSLWSLRSLLLTVPLSPLSFSLSSASDFLSLTIWNPREEFTTW